MTKRSFRGRRRGGLKQALGGGEDHVLRELRAAIAARQERVAQLQLELFDMRSEVESFEQEMEARVGLLRRQIERLEKQVEEARRRAARRAQWGDRADSPDIPEDVVEQFRKTWKRDGKPSPPPIKKVVSEGTKEELKSLYRKLAKKFHPDLATDPEEKKWREVQMARVNQAYSEQDMAALSSFQEDLSWTPKPSQKPQRDEIAELNLEIKRLDGVIAGLERELRELINSETVKWMLDTTIARKAGQDLLRSLERDLMDRIAILQSELASIT